MFEVENSPIPESTEWLLGDTVAAAQKLLGMRLRIGGMEIRITETEAYTADDPASHAFTRRYAAGAIMNTAGVIYVYRIYGIHHCLNITTDSRQPGAVLIRAGEPLTGIELMRQRRSQDKLELLTVGPGRLCQALGVDGSFSGEPLGRRVHLLPGEPFPHIVTTTRIGISVAQERPYRFFADDNRFHHN
ncbi:DNA-3-methyladenine glycosylase [bacterium]|nr:DNA-3-methyladenine glycosylase [bacterium]